MSDGPKSYGPRCGGHSPENDAFNCNQQQAQQQNQINHSGGDGCKVVVPTASGGVDVNSPDNNTSNAAGLAAVASQGRANRQYDIVGDYKNAANQPTVGGKKTKKRRQRSKKTTTRRKKRTSQKYRRRKVFIGCKGRKRQGGISKKTETGWGCMSGGKKFKKHYMWNTKGKRYMAKTYKQHIKGMKLGHSHSKPKRKSRKVKRN